MLRRLMLAVSLLCTSAAFGQIATGTYQFGDFHNHGLDTINVGNLNVHLAIPVVNKPGRGQSFYYNLSYDSSIWYPVTTSGVKAWNTTGLFGWSGDTQAATGYITYSTTVSQAHLTSPTATCTITAYTNWTYHDQFSGAHPFYTGTQTSRGGDDRCSNFEFDDFSETASDGSGYTLNVFSDTGASLTTRDGKTVGAPLNNPSGTAAVTDSNGNQISASGTGTYTDTLGQTVLAIANSGSKSLTYKDSTGTSRTVVVAYKSYTVQTSFGCSGITEYGPTTNSLVSTITLGDGSSIYQFSYEPTPGNSAAVTGRLASVTTPGGGVITYSYTGANDGIECADGSTAGLTRIASSDSPSTTWTYARTTSSTGSHTNVTDGLGNAEDYDFVQPTQALGNTQVGAFFYEVNRNTWTGSTKTNPHTYSQQTCYNKGGPQCLSTAITLPITQLDTYQQFNDKSQDGTTTTYNSYGEVTEVDTHDYGSPYSQGNDERGSVLSKEVLAYGGTSAPANLVSSDIVNDGNGSMASKTTYAYDETTPNPSSGVPSHVAVSAPRGNLTTQTVYSASSTSYATTYAYEDTGTLLTSVDSVNGTTTYAYDSTFTFPTSTSLPTPSSNVAINTSVGYDQSYTGLPTSSTDANSNKTSIASYDALLRPNEVDYPDKGKTTYSYSPTSISTYVYQTSSVYEDVETRLDGYGRTVRVGVKNGSGTWYLQDTCYDGNSNAIFKSYNYTASSLTGAQVCSGAGDTYTYDGLNRVTKVKHGDGTSAAYLYAGKVAQVTDENAVSRMTQVDGLGRPIAVYEVTGNITLNGSVAATSYTTDAGTFYGFKTTYSYNLAGHQTTVTQGSGTTAAQVRTFSTDWIGRPLSTTEPERGTTAYAYSQGNQAKGFGLTVTRKRPKANQTAQTTQTTTTTQYDTLGRVVSIGYDDSLTPARSYDYDQASTWGVSLGASIGHLTHEAAAVGNGTGQIYGYDNLGRVILVGECRPSTCGSSSDLMNYSYDLAGDMLTSTDGNGVRTTYAYTVAAELQSATSSKVDSQDPSSLISIPTTAQSAFGPLNYSLGNGLNAVNTYDGLGRWNGRWVCNSSTNANCSGSGGTQLDGSQVTWKGSRAASATDTYANQTSTYGYDTFNRLTSNTGGATNYSYTYDLLGNRLTQNSQTITFNYANNQMTGFNYDAAGNLLQDAASNNYTYDAEGNVLTVTNTSVGTVTYTYDGANHRVKVAKGSSYQEYDYNAAGQRVSIWSSATTNTQGKYYAGSQPIGYYSGGAIHFEHQDWLGTERIRTTYNTTPSLNGKVEGRYSQAAFGDNYSATGTDTDDNHYASLDLDAPMQTGHAMFRELDDTHGRWSSPDPYDGSYDPSNPQSLNRYSYVLNNPMSLTDPLGDICVQVGGGSYSVTAGNDTTTGYDQPMYECTSGNIATGATWYCVELGNCFTYTLTVLNYNPPAIKVIGPAPNNGTPKPPQPDQVQKCAQQGAAAAAPYNSAAAKALPSTMKMAGTAVLVGAGAGVARARGTPWWAVVSGAILGAASPFAESAANYATGVAVQSATFQGCMAAAGVVPPTF